MQRGTVSEVPACGFWEKTDILRIWRGEKAEEESFWGFFPFTLYSWGQKTTRPNFMITQVLGLRVALREGTPGSCKFASSLAGS